MTPPDTKRKSPPGKLLVLTTWIEGLPFPLNAIIGIPVGLGIAVLLLVSPKKKAPKQ